MIQIISIHIPRTAGTTFYQILQQVYGGQLSISYRRRDYHATVNSGLAFKESLSPEITILHGHLYYREIQDLHLQDRPKIICWLREPTQRVISNFRFFKFGLNKPHKNPEQYAINKHRINESLLEYARKEENRNRMTKFLDGIGLEELFFFGILDSFQQDVERLGKKLYWEDIKVPHLNRVPDNINEELGEEVIQQIKQLNSLDYQLYEQALALRNDH